MKDEAVIIVNEQNAIIESRPRSVMRKRHLIHRATFILVFNAKGELFVQKRSRRKDLYPGYYDLTTGGVVMWNEEMMVSARRELDEELGITPPSLEFLFEFFYESTENRVFGHGYRCFWNGPVHLQEEEIESGEFVPIEKIPRLIDTQPVTPESIYVFNRYQAQFTHPYLTR